MLKFHRKLSQWIHSLNAIICIAKHLLNWWSWMYKLNVSRNWPCDTMSRHVTGRHTYQGLCITTINFESLPCVCVNQPWPIILHLAVSRAIILTSQADKSAPSSEPLTSSSHASSCLNIRSARYLKPSEKVIKHCLQGHSPILNVYSCILLARAILQACFIIGTRR